MADFLTAYKLTSKNEGGYSNNGKDAGGETWKGIARKMWPNWSGWKIIDQHRNDATWPGMLATLKDLEADVQQFYQTNFWNAIKGDQIQSQLEANSIYDSSVNIGIVTAIKLSQQALGITPTGHMDDITLEKINNNA